MISAAIPRLLIGAAGSGSGKTTAVCGLLSALLSQGLRPASFKCGPDYIDPMFHTEIVGAPSRNLDLFFAEEDLVRALLWKNTRDCDLAVMEGVMGYYDGMSAGSTTASAYHLSRCTGTPAILLVNGKGMSVSVAALVKGFAEFREDSGISGVILNQVSPMVYPSLKETVERETGIRVYGYLPKLSDCGLESRHLGLITAAEVGDLKEKVERIGRQLAESVDLPGLLELAQSAPPLAVNEQLVSRKPLASINRSHRPRVGIARDKAFCFYYQDSLDLLTDLGVELVEFSPLEDDRLPEGLSGLLLGGGYPELYGSELASNGTLRRQMKQALTDGLPCIAECGGFLYLQSLLEDENHQEWELTGFLPGKGFPTGKLSRFGYVTLTAVRDGLLCRAGEQIKAHEFHYWDSTDCGRDFSAEKPSGARRWDCVHMTDSLYAGFPHLYLWSNPGFAVAFVERCRDYQETR